MLSPTRHASVPRCGENNVSNAKPYRALQNHGGSMPRALIDLETDIYAIDDALDLLKYGPPCLSLPQRGHRAKAAQTRIIMDLMNRRAALVRQIDDLPEGDNWIAARASLG
jgi:hypothetical protein